MTDLHCEWPPEGSIDHVLGLRPPDLADEPTWESVVLLGLVGGGCYWRWACGITAEKSRAPIAWIELPALPADIAARFDDLGDGEATTLTDEKLLTIYAHATGDIEESDNDRDGLIVAEMRDVIASDTASEAGEMLSKAGWCGYAEELEDMARRIRRLAHHWPRTTDEGTP